MPRYYVQAVDLLLETGSLGLLLAPGAVDAPSHARVCAYLLKCADYLGDSDEEAACVDTAFKLFINHSQLVDALRVALRAGPLSPGVDARLHQVFDATDDASVRKQLAYVLARHRVNFVADHDALDSIIGNAWLPELYAALARDLDTVEAKTPEDIYKSHLSDKREGTAERLDSAKANLAATYVNAFVNAGYGQDKLMTPEDSKWVYKNRDHGQLAAAASLGLIHIWNDSQLSELDKYLHADEENVRAGAVLGMALACTGTRNRDIDPALALLSEHLERGSEGGAAAGGDAAKHAVRMAAIFGLGLAYAGSGRDEVTGEGAATGVRVWLRTRGSMMIRRAAL